MKILMIAPKIKGIGGVETFTRNLSKYLKKEGHNVKILSSEMVPIIPIQGFRNISFALSAFITTFSIREKFDVVHIQDLPCTFPSLFINSSKRVVTLHGIYSESLRYTHSSLLARIIETIGMHFLRYMNVIVAISRSTAEYYKRKGFSVIYIPNGVDFEALPQDGIRLYKKQVVYVGRLSMEKGVDLLISAFKMLNFDAKLYIIGSGPEEHSLKKMADDDARIVFIGAKDHKTTLQIIKGSDLLVLPSRSEGLGLVLLESMAMMVPVVATAVGGITELIDNETTGILSEPNNPTSLANAILKVLEDRESALKRTEQAFLKVKDRYTMDTIAKRYLEVYSVQ